MSLLTLALIITPLSIAFIFARPLQALIARIQLTSERNVGVRILVKNEYYDIRTGARFSHWSGVRGIRLALASLLLKI